MRILKNTPTPAPTPPPKKLCFYYNKTDNKEESLCDSTGKPGIYPACLPTCEDTYYNSGTTLHKWTLPNPIMSEITNLGPAAVPSACNEKTKYNDCLCDSVLCEQGADVEGRIKRSLFTSNNNINWDILTKKNPCPGLLTIPKNADKCSLPPTPPPPSCSTFTSESSCPTAQCLWNDRMNRCIPKTPIRPASDCRGHSVSTCEPTNCDLGVGPICGDTEDKRRCTWDARAGGDVGMCCIGQDNCCPGDGSGLCNVCPDDTCCGSYTLSKTQSADFSLNFRIKKSGCPSDAVNSQIAASIFKDINTCKGDAALNCGVTVPLFNQCMYGALTTCLDDSSFCSDLKNSCWIGEGNIIEM